MIPWLTLALVLAAVLWLWFHPDEPEHPEERNPMLIDVIKEPGRTVAVRPEQAESWERVWVCVEPGEPCTPGSDCSEGCGWFRR